MSDQEPPQISILDARLAEIDKRLRTIQTGLVTDAAAPADATVSAADDLVTATPTGAPAVTGRCATDTTSELPPRVEVPEPGSSVAGLRAVPAPAADQSLAEAVDELRELAVTHESLLGSMRVLLSDYEQALAESRSAPAARALAESQSAPAGAGAGEVVRSLTVTAGPFTGTEAVRGFEQALAALPGVGGVELRGYEGGNHAILDVHLAPSTS
jgi:hypothetical protein